MSLRERLNTIQMSQPAGPPFGVGPDSSAYRALRTDLHAQLLDRVDVEVMGRMAPERLREELRILVERLIG
ncbi:MAG: CpaF family protein, partial [Burkholderiaceae bacterium]|nr:CpaF family protein [Burkholderiaceae bacterium]